MTIVTFRRFRIPKLRDLAMVGIEVRFGNRLVTLSALRHDFKLESCLIRSTDRVGRMTIATHGQRLVSSPKLHRMNTGFKLFLNSVVATAARLRNVPRVHTGQSISVRPLCMSSVAARARRGDGQAALHQAFAVNAFRVVLNDLMLFAGITNGCLFPFPMTSRAQRWNVCRERGRSGIQF